MSKSDPDNNPYMCAPEELGRYEISILEKEVSGHKLVAMGKRLGDGKIADKATRTRHAEMAAVKGKILRRIKNDLSGPIGA